MSMWPIGHTDFFYITTLLIVLWVLFCSLCFLRVIDATLIFRGVNVIVHSTVRVFRNWYVWLYAIRTLLLGENCSTQSVIVNDWDFPSQEEQGPEPSGVQVYLVDGIRPPPVGPRHWHCLPLASSLLLAQRLVHAGTEEESCGLWSPDWLSGETD